MHVLGHRTQTHLVREYEDNLFKYLKQSNYTTILLGKNDVLSAQSFNDSLTFWDGVIGTGGGGNAFAQGEAGYYSFFGKAATNCNGAQWTCNGDLKAVVETVEWLKSDPPEPFFIFLPGIGAHPPYSAPADYFARYTADQVRKSAPLRQLVPGNNKPPHLQVDGITGYRNLTSFHLTDDLFYNLSAVYLGRISYVDYILGVLLDGLDASPLVNNTVLIASSDHGDYQGDFQAVEKWPGGLEDVLTRVPLLFRVPGGAKGLRVSNPVMAIDILPTVLDLAHIDLGPNGNVNFGVSLLPWIINATAPVNAHSFVFSEAGYSNRNEYEPNDPAQRSVYQDPTNMYYPRGREEILAPLDIDRAVMMKNSTHKLVFRPRGTSELYDLVADPKELINLFNVPSYAIVQNELLLEMLRWIILTGDVTPNDDDDRGLPDSPVPPFPWPPQQRARSRKLRS
jgi:choline-sulfatase